MLRLQIRLALRRTGGTNETKDLADKKKLNEINSTQCGVGVVLWCKQRRPPHHWIVAQPWGGGEGSVGCSGSVDGAGAGQTLTGGDSLVLPFLASPPGCGCRDLRARRRRRRRLAGSSPWPPAAAAAAANAANAALGCFCSRRSRRYSTRSASTRVDCIPGNPQKNNTAQCNTKGRFLRRNAARA